MVMTIKNGSTIDRYIPKNLNSMFYRNPNTKYRHARRNGYDPYGFLTDGLVLYIPHWALKNDVFTSIDGYGHICTTTGALWYPDGKYFDGDNDVIVVPDHAALAGMTSGFSAETWMRSNGDAGAVNGLIGKFDALKREWLTGLDDNASYLQVRVYDESADKYIGRKDTVTDVWDNVWHHVVYTWDGTNTSAGCGIYVDGVKTDNTDDEDAVGWIGMETLTADVQIGTRTTGAGFYKNWIGETRLYNRDIALAGVQHNRACTRWRFTT